MSKKDLIEGIKGDIIDVKSTEFSFSTTQIPPSAGDQGFSFEGGEQKKGKIIETCVLFVDIRNSVALTKKHSREKMGKVYTAFAKAVIKAAHDCNGSIRNIIGDRVMVVFPTKNCFTDAVDCAITINHALNIVMAHEFSAIDFKCGIGIDYGELRVIKVGVPKHGLEKYENRGLVWVGDPANIASRLTDAANKEIKETIFSVHYNPYNWARYHYPLLGDIAAAIGGYQNNRKSAPVYQDKINIDRITEKEFTHRISWDDVLNMCYSKGRFIKFKKEEIKKEYPPILMTEIIYEGFKAVNPTRDSIVKKYWTESKHPVKDVSGKIYGGNVLWKLS